MDKKNQNKTAILTVMAVVFATMLIFSNVRALSYSINDIIKPPTLNDCVQMMGMTEEECQEVISGFSSGAGTTFDLDDYGNATGNLPNDLEETTEQQKETSTYFGEQGKTLTGVAGGTSIANVQSQKKRNEQNFGKIERRTEALIDFFKGRGFDIYSLRENLSVFRQKQQEILDQQDLLIEDLSGSNINSQSVLDRQALIKEKTEELIDFYKTTLRTSATQLIGQL